ncbi:MAG: Fe-S protein assembly co-chaperone HscB [Pseudomonadota bacterium]
MQKILQHNQNAVHRRTPFDLLSVKPAYLLDWCLLDHNLAALQETLHPDLYPNGSQERDIADSMSSAINNAYAILKDPIQRARALLSLSNISIPGENGKTINEPELMEEALSLKELLEEATIKNDFDTLLQTLSAKQCILEDQFNSAFLTNNKIGMQNAYVQLSFCIKTLNDAKNLCFKSMEKLNVAPTH